MICLPFDTNLLPFCTPRCFSPWWTFILIQHTGIIDVSASVSGTYEVLATWTEPTSGKVHTSSNTITIVGSDPSFSYPSSTIAQDDGLITPAPMSSGGTFTTTITSGLFHRNNQWGPGKADYLDIDSTTGVIDPSNSLAGVYDITYTIGCESATTSITIRSVNDPGYQLSYASSPICRILVERLPLQ